MRFELEVNGRAEAVDGAPLERLLDVVRERLGLTGTKEGCGEGECGACTVLLEGRPVLSCLVPLAQCAGRRVETVEAVAAGPARGLVERLVEAGGVQCGACTPGIVVTAWALARDQPAPSRQAVREALAGNLCRCTGYESILRSLSGFAPAGGEPAETSDVSAAGAPGSVSIEEAVRRLAADPSLRPIAGCTDLMVGDPEERAALAGVVDLAAVPGLAGIREIASGPEAGGVEIGAATSFAEIRRSPVISERYPALAAAASVVGGWQIQNRATIGGNVANASPAGDSLPVLSALEAVAVAVGAGGERRIPYRDVHTGYRRTALAPGELLAALRLPPPPAGSRQAFRKVGTRAAQAISKVVVAALGRVEDGRIAELRIAAGSVAPVPLRLDTVEREITGRPTGAATAELAGRLAGESVEPIDDVRSTAEYRRFALTRVVRRIVLELSEDGEGR